MFWMYGIPHNASIVKLQQRAVNAHGFEWRPGMMDTEGVRHSWDTRPSTYRVCGSNYWHPPKLEDEATISGMLILVLELYQATSYSIEATPTNVILKMANERGSVEIPASYLVEAIIIGLEYGQADSDEY